MRRIFFAARFAAASLILTLSLTNCEQDPELDSLSSNDANVQLSEIQLNALAGFNGRIAISADGNDHDRDDIGATPMGLAILAQAGLQNKLVHYDYNSHIWGNDTYDQKRDMTESTLGAASRFNFGKGNFISAIDETNKAEKSIADAINESSASNPLYIIAAGPMAVVGEGIKRSDEDKRKYVTVLSHSDWNDDHQHNGSLTADYIKQTSVKFIKIKDQNASLRRDWSGWDWLKNHADINLRWVYERMQVAMRPRADVSDAGLIWYLLHNDQNANPNKLRSFFDGSTPPPPPGGGNGDYCQAYGSTLNQAIKNFEQSCVKKYDKSKGHDCDPDGKGWVCATGDVKDQGGSTPPPPPNKPGGGSDKPDNEHCQATGNTVNQAIKNFEQSCGIKYEKSKGHDCDPDGKGGWICSTKEM